MPREDGTGPMGMGPMTGWGAGRCGGFTPPGFAGRGGFARGLGRGCHRAFMAGRPGWGRYGNAAYNGANEAGYDEKAFLRNRAELLENELSEMKKRLESLDEESK